MDDEIPVHGGSHASSSHEASLEPTFSVYTHFPEDRNCEICKRTKITRAPCRRRNSGAVPCAENFGELITACVRNKLPFRTVQQNLKSSLLNAGLRLDGLPALELWDLIVSVFGSVTQTSDRTGRLVDAERSQKSQGKINVLKNIDCVPSNVQSSHQEALLYVFEDDEAVIKMIIKGRSPTMSHVSRTHTVALDWLFNRINLDPKVQIKYIDTKNQLADILTEGNFTRDEWNHLLCLFNISHFSSTMCSAAIAKRIQHDSEEERVTAKSRPMMNLIATAPSHVSSSTSVSPVKKHYGSQDPWKSVAGEDRSGRPDTGTDLFEASDHHYHEQFIAVSSQKMLHQT